MGKLLSNYKLLENDIANEIKRLVSCNGVATGLTIERGLKVKKEAYVEGRRITHITERVLCAGGLHYDHCCLPMDELIDLLEDLSK